MASFKISTIPLLITFWLTIAFCQVMLFVEVAAYPPGFHNHSGCLYTYMQDGSYKVILSEVQDDQHGLLPINKLSYDAKGNCVNGVYHGSLGMNFDIGNDNMVSISLEMQFGPDEHTGKISPSWNIDKIIMKIVPQNKAQYPNDTFELRAANDIYSNGMSSYSCSSLVLTNYPATNAQFKIILKRFQVQPFAESPLYVFAPSRDCSVWLTLPQVTGFALVLFIIFTALFGVYLLLELGNQQGDLRFSKQGGMLMNQAQLDATKAD